MADDERTGEGVGIFTVDVIRTTRRHSLLPVRDVKTDRAHNYARTRQPGRALSGDPSEAAIYPRNTKRRKSCS